MKTSKQGNVFVTTVLGTIVIAFPEKGKFSFKTIKKIANLTESRVVSLLQLFPKIEICTTDRRLCHLVSCTSGCNYVGYSDWSSMQWRPIIWGKRSTAPIVFHIRKSIQKIAQKTVCKRLTIHSTLFHY